MAAAFDIGDLVRLSCTFTDFSGTATNTTAVLSVKDPSGTTTTPSLTNSGTGVYYADVSMTDDGWWRFRFVGTGTIQAVYEGDILVRASAFV